MATIRKIFPSDLDELVVLFDEYRQFYSQTSDVEKAKNYLSTRIEEEDSIIFVAEEDGKLIGFTQLYPTFSSVSMKKDMILNDLYVFPEYRGKGVGKDLLETAKKFVIENNIKGLWIETANDNPARSLYESLGWEKDVSFVHYYWQP